MLGGYLAQKFSTKRVAFFMLLLSCGCCLLSFSIFELDSKIAFIAFLLFWGMVVIADSPLLSTLVAHHAPVELKGTALTIVNCIGFSITIVSIQLISSLSTATDSPWIFTLLAIGPVFGLMALRERASLEKVKQT